MFDTERNSGLIMTLDANMQMATPLMPPTQDIQDRGIGKTTLTYKLIQYMKNFTMQRIKKYLQIIQYKYKWANKYYI